MIRMRSFALAVLAMALVSAPLAAQPVPPVPPAAPVPPKPPKPPKGTRVQIPDDVRAQAEAEIARARAEIDRALAEIDANPQVPAAMKAKLKAQLKKLRDAKLDDLVDMAGDMQQFGEEMDEYGRQMEAWGEQWGEQFDVPEPPDPDGWGPPGPRAPRAPRAPRPSHAPVVIDMDDDFDFDLDVDVGALKLSPGQRADLKRIAVEEKAAIAPAKQKLRELSRELRGELADDDTDEAEVNRLVDEISAQEGKVRKARLTALTRTRKLLSSAQRTKVDHRTR